VKKIAVASGKGGTGKTTVSLNLYRSFSLDGEDVALYDCDVEEPNDALFFTEKSVQNEKTVNQLIPVIDTAKCGFCRKCVTYCEFNAITIVPSVQLAQVNSGLCHSCGACSVACPFDAITEQPESIGEITKYDVGFGQGLWEGRLQIGSTMQTMLIKEVKREFPENGVLLIYDAPPGTSCPVVETVADVDYVILVTEPTPFGLHDLKLTVELLEELGKPFGVVINKSGLGNRETHEFLSRKGIEVLGEIPFSRKYAAAYAAGNLFDQVPDELEAVYHQITEKVGHYLAAL
jgi:MinD superfamily P-loop ATPase